MSAASSPSQLDRVVVAGVLVGTTEALAYDEEWKVVCPFKEFYELVAKNSTAYAQSGLAQWRPVINGAWWVFTPELICRQGVIGDIPRVEVGTDGPFKVTVNGAEMEIKHDFTVNDLSKLGEYWPNFGRATVRAGAVCKAV